MKNGPLTALGLMSGTSMDGIDVALLRTDGEKIYGFGPTLCIAYNQAFRKRLRELQGDAGSQEVSRELTMLHADAVAEIIRQNGIGPTEVDVIGFHGHSIAHNPEQGITRQIGDGALLASETGIDVISDFRSADVACGGQGAPLAPLFHAALAADMKKPLAILNIGGVANVTWLGDDGEIIAFDVGPGNALIDDWLLKTCNLPFDEDGQLAGRGAVEKTILATLADNPYFTRKPPKSLDRNDFARAIETIAGLSPADGAATLSAFTATAAAQAGKWFPRPPREWLVCGGGRHNSTLMGMLADAVGAPTAAVENTGWNGDAMEAQAFAYLAVRSVRGKPLSLPTTTGVSRPTTGGVHHKKENR